MATSTTRIPSELSDQWSIEEREKVDALIKRREELLEVAGDPESEIDQAADADAEAEQILEQLDTGFNVTPDMLTDQPPAPEPPAAEPEPGPDQLPLAIPGAGKASTSFDGVRVVALEGKMMGSSVRQLGGEVHDPDRIVELRVLARLDHNEETPVRDGTGLTARTQSAVKRQVFRVLEIEVV